MSSSDSTEATPGADRGSPAALFRCWQEVPDEWSDSASCSEVTEEISLDEAPDLSEHRWHYFEMRPLLPRALVSTGIISIGVANCVWFSIVTCEVFLTSGMSQAVLIFACYAGVCCTPVAIIVISLVRRKTQRHLGLLGVWMVMLAVLNAALHCTLHHDHKRCGSEYTTLSASLGGWLRSPMEHFAWLWMMAVILYNIHLPTQWPGTSQQLLCCLAYYSAVVALVGCIPTMLSQQCRTNGYALVSTACGIGSFMPLIMSEIVAFLRQGDAAGCDALMYLPSASCLLHLVGLCASRLVTAEVCVTSAAACVITACLRFGVHETATMLCVASPLYYVRGGQKPSSALFGRVATLPVVTLFDRISLWLRTWRGINLAFLGNGVMTFVLYSFFWSGFCSEAGEESSLQAEGKFVAMHFPSQHTGQFVILTIAAWVIVLAGSNLVRHHLLTTSPQSAFIRWLPHDTHFRGLTLMKTALFMTKVDMLLFLCPPVLKEDHGRFWTVVQLLSIAGTSGVVMLTTTRVYFAALDFEHFTRMFRSGRIVWHTAMVSLVVVYATSALLLCSKELTSAGIVRILSQGEENAAAILLARGILWVFITNEVALLLSSRISNPRVFEAVYSPRGVKALIGYMAAYFPMQMFLATILRGPMCDYIHMDFHSSFFVCLSVGTAVLLSSLVSLAYCACGEKEAYLSPASLSVVVESDEAE